ncbi:hypothetical protein NP233_g4618 [Leucocoprinus birnbaumii]|uniref:Arrestin-like N-terminal domain-containing protein n=1 Tax=Leucocoprinus birnbaumii TaxID=56174 RepID=A0AAD5VUN6_9AGAR|nr:hypothetical protein NP233_g4618 [Leucocoprinus birnbaumii]
MEFQLPQYSPSAPAPGYSCQPACGELSLEQTPRQARPVAESTFIRRCGKSTLAVLYNQEENIKLPAYGREAPIAGSILFDSADDVCEVVLEIFGKVETMSSDGGAKTTTVIDNRRILWSDSLKNGRCPCQIEFSVRLPATFRDDHGEERPLPPTYSVDFHGIPALYVRTSYFIQMLITRNLSKKVGFLTKTKRMFVPFEYYPRTRPNRPIIPSLCFFSGVKSTPEEWYQTIAPMKTPLNTDPGPIFTHLLIPSSRIYGIRDSIPFHVQLSGPEEALRAFLQPKPKEPARRVQFTGSKLSASMPSVFPNPSRKMPPPRLAPLDGPSLFPAGLSSPTLPSPPLSPTISRVPSAQQLSSAEPPTPLWSDDATRPTLRVFLLRQITIETRSGKKSWRNQVLGEAKLVNVPPLLATSCYSPYGVAEPQEEDHLDWEGELQINNRYNVGGWQAAGVHVKFDAARDQIKNIITISISDTRAPSPRLRWHTDFGPMLRFIALRRCPFSEISPLFISDLFSFSLFSFYLDLRLNSMCVLLSFD